MKVRQVYTNNTARAMIFAGSRGKLDIKLNDKIQLTFDVIGNNDKSIMFDMTLTSIRAFVGNVTLYTFFNDDHSDRLQFYVENDGTIRQPIRLRWSADGTYYTDYYMHYDTLIQGETEQDVCTIEDNVKYFAKPVGHISFMSNSIFVDNECNDSTFKNRCTYTSDIEAVRQYLLQHLAIIQHERWYNYEYGLPLLDNTASKAIMDAAVAMIISEQPDIINAETFESCVENHAYHLSFSVMTKYGKLDMIDTL